MINGQSDASSTLFPVSVILGCNSIALLTQLGTCQIIFDDFSKIVKFHGYFIFIHGCTTGPDRIFLIKPLNGTRGEFHHPSD